MRFVARLLALSAASLAAARGAQAGCAVDAERDARQAAAPLVVVGRVTAIEVVEERGEPVVYEAVRVDRVLKGRLEEPGIRLRTTRPSGLCPSGVVFAPGERVYAIGTPDADMTFDVSPCTDDVGLADRRADLRAVAKKQPAKAGRFAGVAAPEHPAAPLPGAMPTADGRRAWVVDGARERAATRLAQPSGTLLVQVIVDFDGLEVVESVAPDRLVPVVSRRVPLRDGAGLAWVPGTPVDVAGAPRLPAGWSTTATVPADAVATSWLPVETDAPTGAPLSGGPVTFFDRPGGAELARADIGAQGSFFADGPVVDGWRAVRVSSPTIVGRAFVRAADLAEDREAEGGVVGGVWGGFSNADPVPLWLSPGPVIRAADGSAVAWARNAAPVDWLATRDGRAWVTFRSLDRWVVGEVACVGSEGVTRCEAPSAPR
jgi:hypothetical protein